MQIDCPNCKCKSETILNNYKFICDDLEKVPVYQCKTCETNYVKIFSHGMKVIMQNGSFVPDGELIVDMFVEEEKVFENT